MIILNLSKNAKALVGKELEKSLGKIFSTVGISTLDDYYTRKINYNDDEYKTHESDLKKRKAENTIKYSKNSKTNSTSNFESPLIDRKQRGIIQKARVTFDLN